MASSLAWLQYNAIKMHLQNFKTQYFLLYCLMTELITTGISVGYLDGHLDHLLIK